MKIQRIAIAVTIINLVLMVVLLTKMKQVAVFNSCQKKATVFLK